MKRALAAAAVVALSVTARTASATPSTVFWTPATTYTQPYLVPHLTFDTYVAERGALQNDYGLTLGVLPGDKVLGEVGLDVFLPSFGRSTLDYVQLNAKLTLAEGAFAKWQPGISVGLMNAGFEEDVSDYHLLHATAGKALPFGTVAVGGYYGLGSELLWTGSDGEARAGLMASYTSPDFVVDLPGLNKIVLGADLATGQNWFGAVGGGAAFFFTPAVSLLTGPVWLLDSEYYADNDFLWTFQLDVDIDLIKKKQ
ncbi:MAG TPA: hypothetical protein VEA99_12000 [Gemmatimonadaceae bacterium]|nr:hypothetical protein [Gemmatimonadaceae bacterium]